MDKRDFTKPVKNIKTRKNTPVKRLLTRQERDLISEYNRFHPLARRCVICGLAGQIACPHRSAA